MTPENGEVGYFTQTVAEKLNLTRSKIGHMSTALEKQGYPFTRNHRKYRIYFDRDLVAIAQLQEKMSHGKKVADAAKEVVAETIKERGYERNLKNGSAREVPEESIPDHQASDNLLQVRDGRNTGVRLTADQLRLMVEEVAATTAEETAGRVIEKYNNAIERTIEMRDKQLVSRLREANETARERNRRGWLSKMFGVR